MPPDEKPCQGILPAPSLQEKTEEYALGRRIAAGYNWDTRRILTTFFSALQEANAKEEAAQVQAWLQEYR